LNVAQRFAAGIGGSVTGQAPTTTGGPATPPESGSMSRATAPVTSRADETTMTTSRLAAVYTASAASTGVGPARTVTGTSFGGTSV
jgi:hypothetical protein